MARIDFLTCHLSGTGHFVRTATLAATAAARGHAVRVISGGRPLAHVAAGGIDVVQLPWVGVRGLDFGTLLDADGMPADRAYMDRRRSTIIDTLRDRMPDVLVTETWPFGRRALVEEFTAAADAARRGGAQLVASVRDIPEPKPHRIGEVADRLEDFAGVLVHGDRAVMALDENWPLPAALTGRIHHVGYMGRAIPDAEPGEEVLVSLGGGTLGDALLPLAAAAARLSDRPWRIRVGGADVGSRIAAAGSVPDHVTIEPVAEDFARRIAAAACSISLAGYNTCVELLQTRTPALLIPSEEGGEQEQPLRAAALARLPGIRTVRAGATDDGTLCALAEELARGPRRPASGIVVDRGERAVAKLEAMLEERR